VSKQKTQVKDEHYPIQAILPLLKFWPKTSLFRACS